MQLNDRFYKSTEVSDILGVSLRTLYRYMDSGKIESVQLPSGRHRFTKKQIEDFLYSNNLALDTQVQTKPLNENVPQTNVNISVGQGVTTEPNFSGSSNLSQAIHPVQVPVVENTQDPTPIQADLSEVSSDTVHQNKSTEEDTDANLEAELDALLASLDDDFASGESQAETEEIEEDLDKQFSDLGSSLNNDLDSSTTPVAPSTSDNLQNQDLSEQSQADRIVEDLSQSTSESTSISGFGDSEPKQEQQEPVYLDENKVNYFYCPYNDLRTVAKMVKKVGDDENVDYAFTMNAGLSLFFPLDPFSVIHFYVAEKDLDVWKQNLQLKETSKDEANLGVLITRGQAFEGSREVSGLKVVSKNKLIQNLNANGLTNLASQAESKLD